MIAVPLGLLPKTSEQLYQPGSAATLRQIIYGAARVI